MTSLFSWFLLSILGHRLTLDFTDYFICTYLHKSVAKFNSYTINLKFYIWSNNPKSRVHWLAMFPAGAAGCEDWQIAVTGISHQCKLE
jgi:hypothetical protein